MDDKPFQQWWRFFATLVNLANVVKIMNLDDYVK